MVELYAFRRSFRFVSFRVAALALCSAAIFASATPASARSHHITAAGGTLMSVTSESRRGGIIARVIIIDDSRALRVGHAGVAQMRAGGFANANASFPSAAASQRNGRIQRVRFIGCRRRSAPLHRRQSDRSRQPVVRAVHEHGAAALRSSRHRLRYGEFVRPLRPARLRPAGRRHRRDGTGRGGGHVGVVSGIDASGNPIVISGNNGNRVREAPISRGRIYAYVMPTG